MVSVDDDFSFWLKPKLQYMTLLFCSKKERLKKVHDEGRDDYVALSSFCWKTLRMFSVHVDLWYDIDIIASTDTVDDDRVTDGDLLVRHNHALWCPSRLMRRYTKGFVMYFSQSERESSCSSKGSSNDSAGISRLHSSWALKNIKTRRYKSSMKSQDEWEESNERCSMSYKTKKASSSSPILETQE